MAVPGERAHGDGQRELLLGIERYYDAVPRTAADVEAWGLLTLFVQRPGGWPYYARPALGSGPDTPFRLEDVQRVRARQRELGIPAAFEWVHDVTPGLRAAVEAAGLEVHTYPLMVLDLGLTPPVATVVQEGVSVRLVAADEPDAVLRRMDAVARVGLIRRRHGCRVDRCGGAGLGGRGDVGGAAGVPPRAAAHGPHGDRDSGGWARQSVQRGPGG